MEITPIFKHLKQKQIRELGILKMLKDKRGMGIADLYPVMLTICLVAILIAIVLFILDEFGQQMPLREVVVANESITAFHGTVNQTLAGVDECGFGTVTPADVVIYNETVNVPIDATNYTVYPDGNIINLTEDISMYAWRVSYDFDWRGTACEATEDISQDISDFIPWIGIILLVIAAAIVLGILIRNLAGGSGRV